MNELYVALLATLSPREAKDLYEKLFPFQKDLLEKLWDDHWPSIGLLKGSKAFPDNSVDLLPPSE